MVVDFNWTKLSRKYIQKFDDRWWSIFLEKSKSRGCGRRGPSRARGTSGWGFRCKRSMVEATASIVSSSSSSSPTSSPLSSSGRLLYVAIAHSQQPCHDHEAVLHAGWSTCTLTHATLFSFRALSSAKRCHCPFSNVKLVVSAFPRTRSDIRILYLVRSRTKRSDNCTKLNSLRFRFFSFFWLQLTWVFHDDEAQINKKLPKELLLRYCNTLQTWFRPDRSTT